MTDGELELTAMIAGILKTFKARVKTVKRSTLRKSTDTFWSPCKYLNDLIKINEEKKRKIMLCDGHRKVDC